MKKLLLVVLVLIMGQADAMWYRKQKSQQPTQINAIHMEALGTAATQKPAAQKIESFETEPIFETPAEEQTQRNLANNLFQEAKHMEDRAAAMEKLHEVALIAALNTGDANKLKQLIEEEKIDISKPFKLPFYQGNTPIEVVFEKNTPNKLEVAEVLLNAGADKKAA